MGSMLIGLTACVLFMARRRLISCFPCLSLFKSYSSIKAVSDSTSSFKTCHWIEHKPHQRGVFNHIHTVYRSLDITGVQKLLNEYMILKPYKSLLRPLRTLPKSLDFVLSLFIFLSYSFTSS